MRLELRQQGPWGPWVSLYDGSHPWPNVLSPAWWSGFHHGTSKPHCCSLSLLKDSHLAWYHSSESRISVTGLFAWWLYFLCTLSIHPACIAGWMLSCRLYGITNRANGIYMVNLMWQLIYILWQDTSNRHHWLQALSFAFLFLGHW